MGLPCALALVSDLCHCWRNFFEMIRPEEIHDCFSDTDLYSSQSGLIGSQSLPFITWGRPCSRPCSWSFHAATCCPRFSFDGTLLLSPAKSTACAGVAPASPSSGDLSHHGPCCSAVVRGPERWEAHIPSRAHRACSGPADPPSKKRSCVTCPVSEVGLSVLPVPRQSSTFGL